MILRKVCEHGFFDPHRVEDLSRTGLHSAEVWYLIEPCPGGTEPTVEELIAELDRLGAISHIDWKPDVPAPYDIEIPDFVNRHGMW